MGAAAFKATLIFAQGSLQGPRFSYYCTASDIAAATYIFQDGAADATLPQVACYLVDVILTPAYGTDTTTADIFANNKPTPNVIVNSANQGGTYSRQFQSSPMGFMPGARIKIIQRA